MSRKYLVQRRPGSLFAVPPSPAPFPDDVEGRVQSDLAVDLPDEDLTEDLDDALDFYVMGSKPRCEEVEYLEMMEDAIDRIARGG